MDPILLATHIKRPLYFLARGDAFKSTFSRWLFTKLHMIPVYRPNLVDQLEAAKVEYENDHKSI